MPGPTNTMLIEGSFEELADELAQYIDGLKNSPQEQGLQQRVQALLQDGKKDDALKELIVGSQALNAAPEKGAYHCVDRRERHHNQD